MEDNKLSTDKGSLLKYYKYVYICEKPGCSNAYGSDKEEKEEHICPTCEDKQKKN